MQLINAFGFASSRSECKEKHLWGENGTFVCVRVRTFVCVCSQTGKHSNCRKWSDEWRMALNARYSINRTIRWQWGISNDDNIYEFDSITQIAFIEYTSTEPHILAHTHSHTVDRRQTRNYHSPHFALETEPYWFRGGIQYVSYLCVPKLERRLCARFSFLFLFLFLLPLLSFLFRFVHHFCIILACTLCILKRLSMYLIARAKILVTGATVTPSLLANIYFSKHSNIERQEQMNNRNNQNWAQRRPTETKRCRRRRRRRSRRRRRRKKAAASEKNETTYPPAMFITDCLNNIATQQW